MVSGLPTRSQAEFSNRVNIFVLNAVFQYSKAKGSSLGFLLALAKFADNDGVCWPGMAAIAKLLHCSTRQAQNYLADLVHSKEIRVELRAGPKKTNRYRILCVDKALHARQSVTKQTVQVDEVPNTRTVKTVFRGIKQSSPDLTVPAPVLVLKEKHEASNPQQAGATATPLPPPVFVQALAETGNPLTPERREYYASILAKIIDPEAYRRRIPLNRAQLRALRNRMNTGGLPWPREGSWLDAQVRRPI